MRRSLRLLALALASVLLFGGCEAGDGTPTGAATSPTPTSSSTSMPTFAPDTAVGTLAPGFPAEYAQLPENTQVVASAATPGQATTRISLTLRSTLSADELGAYYAQLLTGLGYTAVPTSTPSGLAAIAGYTRTTSGTPENLTVAILDDGSARSVSVSGDVVPAK